MNCFMCVLFDLSLSLDVLKIIEDCVFCVLVK